MNDEEYFRINGHYPIDPQSDISERFAGEGDYDDPEPYVPSESVSPNEEPECNRANCKGPAHPEYPGWIVCESCGDSVQINSDACPF